MSPPAALFRELVAELSGEAFTELVARIWEARAEHVEEAGDVLLAGDPDPPEDRTVLLPVVDPDRPPDPAREPDVVVVAVDPERLSAVPAEDAEIIGPEDLRERLLYGVPRPTAKTAVQATLERPLDAIADNAPLENPSLRGNRSDRASGDDQSPARKSGQSVADASDGHGPANTPSEHSSKGGMNREENRWRSTIVYCRDRVVPIVGILFVTACIVALVLATEGLLGAPPDGQQSVQNSEDEFRKLDPSAPRVIAPVEERTPNGGPSAPEQTVTPSPRMPADAFPPGIGSEGVTDPTRLWDAHARAITGRSYRASLVYRETRDGRLRGGRRESIRVARPSVFRTDAATAGQEVAATDFLTGVDSYSDGNVTYYRAEDPEGPDYRSRVTTMAPGEHGPQATRAGRIVAQATATDESAILDTYRREGHRFFWIRFSGDAVGTDLRGSLLVDSRGIVHELRYRYRPDNHTSLTAQVTLRYERFGGVTVEPPPWYHEARNTTDGESTTENATP